MPRRLTLPRIAALISSVGLVAGYLIFFRPGATASPGPTSPGNDPQRTAAGNPTTQPATATISLSPATNPSNKVLFFGSKSGAISVPTTVTGNTIDLPQVTPVTRQPTTMLPGSKSASILIPPARPPSGDPPMLLPGSKSIVLPPVPQQPTQQAATTQPAAGSLNR